jgi:thiol-disulfide isomerase/thioredoxin
MTFMNRLRSVLSATLMTIATQANGSNSVTELTAADLASFVKRHDTVVVQVFSSDPKCGGCPGADKKFDQLAEKSYRKPVVFARVQWAVWQDMPKFDTNIKVFAVPVQLLFKNGVQIDTIEVNLSDPKDEVDSAEAIEELATRNLSSADVGKVLPSPFVIDLQAEQLPTFLKKHPWAMVQFLSSDINCGFCVSAAYSFNSAAKYRVDKQMPFARVQWGKPWRNIPSFGETYQVLGIPAQIVFRNGVKVGGLDGKPQDRNAIFRAMNEALEKNR